MQFNYEAEASKPRCRRFQLTEVDPSLAREPIYETNKSWYGKATSRDHPQSPRLQRNNHSLRCSPQGRYFNLFCLRKYLRN